ncbi:hypothetical protein HYFRA_00002050 [Hymenoscyphus fraxineus]|uniref:Uncharacterized protein n=1 Tax=Hymenoscyphus fraxineus TaxID=746836 RepID=A0A9N9PMQ0_9HELO|nr:hypothetical protein HYFRA_00002050 [Hymenoscyphus fraxineus]
MSLGATRRPPQEKAQQESLPKNAAVDEMMWFQPVSSALALWGRRRGHCSGDEIEVEAIALVERE